MQTINKTIEQLNGFNDWLLKEMERWKVPGAAIGVLYDGEIVFAEGFGYRDVEKQLPVDADTLFAIGSCSKAFTTFDMGLLVDEGKLNWDTPLRDYLPDFRLYDEAATQYATPRDIVSHRTGLPRHDNTWYGSPATREELFQRLRHLKPNKTFRQRYEYQNLMFMTAGYLVGRLTGTTWEEFTQRRVLDPLGMSRTNFSVSVSETADNAALPYTNRKGEMKAIPFRNLDAVGPAGSINSNVNDMLKWLALHLNGGRHGDTQIISEATLRETHTAQTVMPITPDMPWYGRSEIANTAYALGWAVQTYRNRNMVRHTGGIDGFISSVSFFPEDKFGVIVLTNVGDTFPATAFAFNLFDRLLGLEPLDWSDRLQEHKTKMEEAARKHKDETLKKRIENTQPSRALADYAGVYENPGYGTLVIEAADDALGMRFNGESFRLEHFHHDTFTMTNGTEDVFTLVSFGIDAFGDIQTFYVGWEPTVEPIAFQKQRDAK